MSIPRKYTYAERRLDSLRDQETGRLARPSRVAALRVTDEVRLDDKAHLVFSGDHHRVEVPSDLLERFLQLETDASILAFAAKFGQLRFDPTHAYERLAEFKKHGFDPLSDSYSLGESVEMWRRARRQFSKLLALAVELKEDERPSRALMLELRDLGVDFVYSTPHEPEWPSWPAFDQRAAAELDLTWHLELLGIVCHLRPAVSIVNFGKRGAQFDLVLQDIEFNAVTLFGALVVQLMAAVTGSGFANCKSCGRMYVPSRRPRKGERTYCSGCGRAAAVRDAKARFRARNATKGKRS